MSTKKQILMIKNKVYEARAKYMLPYYLAYLVYQLKGSEDVNYIRFLMEQTKHWLRVKNYYKDFKLAENAAEKAIKDGLFKLGYYIDVNA